jgi:polygalacturonase
MKFHVLNLTCCSATFELSNQDIYLAKKNYSVKLNKEIVYKDYNRNVFTIFDLEPNTEYNVSIGSDSLKFKTKKASYVLHMKDFLTDGEDDNLRVQSAISALPKDGLLVFDPGEYHVTSLFLKSHITLEIKKGAALLGNTDIKAYPLIPGEIKADNKKPLELTAWEGNPFLGKPSLINAYECEDVTITGQGIIDGQAQKSDFWKDVKTLTWARPRLLFFVRCTNINVIGITVENTPCWTIHPYFSKQLGFYDIEIINPKDAPNTDGLDPESCNGVKIIGVRFSVGDDCIALKSGKIYIGKTFKEPCQNIVIRNCFMNEGHGAIVLGSEAGAGIKNLTVERCLFKHTDRGLRIKSRRGRGQDSIMDNVVFRDIRMENVLTPLVINMFYFCDPDGKSDYVQSRAKAKVDERTPYLGSFTFERLTCLDAEWALGFFFGLPERPIGSITIKDSRFTVKKEATSGYPAMMCGIDKMSKAGFIFSNVKKVTFSNVKASGYNGKKYVTEQVSSVIDK